MRARGTRAMRADAEEAEDGARELVGYGWALCTMVLVSPVTWEHHAVWLLPAFIICIGVAIRWLTRAAEPVRRGRARGAWVGLMAGVLGYALMMDHLPFGFDLSLSTDIGPYLLGVPLRPVFMLVRPAATGLVWLALGLLFVRPGEWAARRPLPPRRAPASPAKPDQGDPRPRGRSVDALLAGTLASLALGIVVVAGTYTSVQALVH